VLVFFFVFDSVKEQENKRFRTLDPCMNPVTSNAHSGAMCLSECDYLFYCVVNIQARLGPYGSEWLRFTEFLVNRDMKVVKLSDLRTGRL
jgi:hypothetical protein